MTLHDAIFVRRSTRVYETDPLSEDMLDAIRAFLCRLRPLDPTIPVGIDILGRDDIKRGAMGRAPHYIAFYSAESGDYRANAGFMMEQINLFLSTLNLGSCWLGGAKPAHKTKRGLVHITTLAFGKTDENPHHYPGDHKRKSLGEVASGRDTRLAAAHLAPSAMNGQPWYFVCRDGVIDLYRKKQNPVLGLILDKMNRMDMGIALCHICLAGEQEGIPFCFTTDASPIADGPAGYTFFGQVAP